MKGMFTVVVLAAVATGAVRALPRRAYGMPVVRRTEGGVVHSGGGETAARRALPRSADPTHRAATPRHATRLRWALGAYRQQRARAVALSSSSRAWR